MPDNDQVLPPSPPEPRRQEPRSFEPAPPKKSNAKLWIGLGVGCGVGGLLLIGIVAAVFMSALGSVRGRAMRANCQSNLRMIGLAVNGYSEDYDGDFPPSLAHLYPNYGIDAKVFSCPSSPSHYQDLPSGAVGSGSSGYVYLPGRFCELPGDFFVAYDKPGNHRGEGVNVVYVDGHVQWWKLGTASDKEAFEKALAVQEEQLPELRRKRDEARKSGAPLAPSTAPVPAPVPAYGR